MLSCESTQSWKVPFKSCQNTVIPHNLVTIRLSVEWPVRGGDDPNLVIDITDKNPSTLYFQQNQPPPALVVNSVHHHQQQESFNSTYQQQYYHRHHSTAMNNHNQLIPTKPMTNADQNDFSSTTTTTVVYNTMPTQSQTSTSPSTNHQIKPESKTQLSPIINRRQTPSNQQYLSPQHVIQTPAVSMDDPRVNMQMPTISPTSTLKPMPSVTTHFADLQPTATMNYPPSTMTMPPMKSLICSCSNPPNVHDLNCPVVNLTKQQPNITLSNEPTYRPSIDRTTAQRAVYAPQARSDGAISISSMNNPIMATNLLSFPNPNLMKSSGPTSSVTTIISQQPQFANYNPIAPIRTMPLLETDNNFQQQSSNFSQVIINNPSHYQTNPSISIPTVGQQASTPTNFRKSKKRPSKEPSTSNQDGNSFQSSNDSQQQSHSITNHNSPAKQPITNLPRRLSSPIVLEQGTFMRQDSSRRNSNLSSDNTPCGSTNDMSGNTPQQQTSPRTMVMIRSPVELNVRLPQTSLRASSELPELDEVISDVVNGEGNILDNNTQASTGVQQQTQSLPTRPVSDNNRSFATTTYLSPSSQNSQVLTYNQNTPTVPYQNFVNITRELVPPPVLELNRIDALLQQPITKNSTKKNRSKPTKKTGTKRLRKTINTVPHLTTTTSSSHPNMSRTSTTTSSITPKPIPWNDLHRPSLLSACVAPSTTTTLAPLETQDQHSAHALWGTSGTNRCNQIPDVYISNDEHGQMAYSNSLYDFELEDFFQSKADERFDSSTPPPLPPPVLPPAPMPSSVISQILTPASTEKSSTRSTASVTNPDEFYDDFFPQSLMVSFASSWEENHLTQSVLTPPDPQNNRLPQQPYPSQLHECFDTDPQSQTSTTPVPETNSNPVNPMNNDDDVQTSSKQQQQQPLKQKPPRKSPHQSNCINNTSSKQSSKVFKQPNRSISNQKQPSTKLKCTRCGSTRLHDITHHEFPKQKGLVFECAGCGNNSIRSNVSADERRRRLAKVATDHLSRVECQFCHKIFHAHNDYLKHLRDDHNSNK